MAVNRMVSLDDVTDAIRKKMVANGTNFSHWIRQQLLKAEEVHTDTSSAKPKPPKNYLCRNCMQPGHWTADCPYLEVEQ